jgi:hypothetical protein
MKGLLHTNNFNDGKLLQWKSLELELGINMVLSRFLGYVQLCLHPLALMHF